MSITTTDRPAFLPKIATSAPELSDEQIELLESTRDKYFDCVTRMIQVEGLKQVLRRASADFAEGKITLHEATALCSVTNSSIERHALQKTLNHAVKIHIKEVLAEAHELVILAAKHRHAELLEKCKIVEASERDNAEDCGIAADDFQPSPNLASLRHTTESAQRTLGIHRNNKYASAVELREVCTLCGVDWEEPDRSAILAAMLDDEDEADEDDEAEGEIFEDDLSDLAELLAIELDDDQPLDDGE